MSGFVFTASGKRLDPMCLEPCDIEIGDIAHSLAHQCRYNGATSQFYSVAEHSIFVSQYVPPEDAFAGLMHDAAEAYIGDVVKPLREQLPRLDDIEASIWFSISSRYGLPLELPASVLEVDRRIVANEIDAFFPDSVQAPLGYDTKLPGLRFYAHSPPAAYHLFLHHFEELR